VREYTEKYYLPLAEKYVARSSDKGVAGTRIVQAQKELTNKWNEIHFGEVKSNHIENGYSFSAMIYLAGINPDNILIELYADGKDEVQAERIEMKLQSPVGEMHVYHAEIITRRQPNDYTVRVIPRYENITVPLEDNHIIWQQ
jgi:starch phosphorylase